MKSVSLNANIREYTGKKPARKLERASMIPAVLYSKNNQSRLLKLDYNEIQSALEKYGEHIIVKLMVDNEEMPAIIKEVQKDPVSYRIIHIDFQPVSLHEVIHADVPVLIINGDRVEKNGWIINKQLGQVEVQGEVESIPRNFTIDASKLKLGEVLRVADLEISKELSILSDIEDIILSIKQFKEEPIDLIFPTTAPELIEHPKD